MKTVRAHTMFAEADGTIAIAPVAAVCRHAVAVAIAAKEARTP
jgi:hypothetical protein